MTDFFYECDVDVWRDWRESCRFGGFLEKNDEKMKKGLVIGHRAEYDDTDQ